MKYLDKVKLIKDRKEYKKEGIYSGRIGTIMDAEIRDNCFHVIFIDSKHYDKNFIWTDENISTLEEDIFLVIKIEDLELVSDNHTSDEVILDSLPKNDPRWWCKVEDGFIYNLLGEKKNKIAYDYDS